MLNVYLDPYCIVHRSAFLPGHFLASQAFSTEKGLILFVNFPKCLTFVTFTHTRSFKVNFETIIPGLWWQKETPTWFNRFPFSTIAVWPFFAFQVQTTFLLDMDLPTEFEFPVSSALPRLHFLPAYRLTGCSFFWNIYIVPRCSPCQVGNHKVGRENQRNGPLWRNTTYSQGIVVILRERIEDCMDCMTYKRLTTIIQLKPQGGPSLPYPAGMNAFGLTYRKIGNHCY